MAIGRISGPLLKSNLVRNGVDLAFETNLLYLDVTNSRIGIGTSTPSTALDVAGTTTTQILSVEKTFNGLQDLVILENPNTGADTQTSIRFTNDGSSFARIIQNGANYGGTTGANSLILSNSSTDGNTLISTNNNTKNFTFGADGSLTLPASTNGSTLIVGNGNGIGLSIGNKTWTFNTAGNLAVPGKITGLIDPSSNQDAATKYYVDNAISSFSSGINFVGDDSTGIKVYLGNTLKIAGGTNVTTNFQDSTLYINTSRDLNVNSLQSDDSTAIQINDGINVNGDATVNGNLTVNGTITTINSTQVDVADKNLVLGNTTSPDNTTANGGGITLKGSSDKTFNWYNSTNAWTSSENINIASGKTYKINGTTVLSSTEVLGKSVPVGTIVGDSDIQTLTNKTLSSPKIDYILTNSGSATLTLPQSTDTVVARDTTDTLTNKTINLTDNTLSGTIAQFNSALSDADFATLNGVETLSNKTLASPKINYILTTHDSTISTLTLPSSTDTVVARDTTDTLTNKTIDSRYNTILVNNVNLTDVTGTGKVVLQTSPTLITPNLGTPSAVDLSNATNLSLTTGVTDTLPVAKGGTGTTDGSITGTGALTFTATGSNKNINLVPTGLGSVDVASKKITSVANPTEDQDAATKYYVDNAISGATSPIHFVGDDSTTADVQLGDTLKISGGNNIRTQATNGTITITGSADIHVNSIQSDDSTAIQVNDGLNVSGDLTVNGTSSLGLIQISGNTITSYGSNGNIVLAPNGSGVIDASGANISNLKEPQQAQDAATKYYVDHIASGINLHASVAAGTTGTLASLTGGTVNYDNDTGGLTATLTLSNPLTYLDNYLLQTGDRVMIKNEADATTNGIYTIGSDRLTLTRADDFNQPAEIAGGDYIFVVHGDTYRGTGWISTGAITTIGTDPIHFTQFSGPGTYQAGTGLSLNNNIFSVNSSQIQITELGTITTGTWHADIISPEYGGTGINNGSSTITLNGGNLELVGGDALTLRTSNTTDVTLPTTGTLSTLDGTETLTNKTLTTPKIDSILSNGGLSTLTLPSATDTLVGKATTDTLTNKSINLTDNTLTGTIAEFNTALTDGDFATLAGIETLTNKTLTSPKISSISNTGTVTLPTDTTTLVGKDTTDTLTNKTFDTAGTGNVLKINGTQISAVTGTGSVVLASSPTLTSPTLGAASATSINNVAITNPGTGSTLTIADGKTLATNNSVTFNGTDNSSVNFGTGGTVLYSGGPLGTPSSATLTNATGLPVSTGISGLGAGIATFLSTPSSNNLASAVTDETGSGSLVFGTSPTLITPVISSIVNSGTLTLPTSTDTLVGKATTDVFTNKNINLADNTLSGTIAQFNAALSDADFATLNGIETLTNKTLSSPKISAILTNNGTATVTLPTSTDTLVGKATTDTFTNKTLDTAGTGNVLKINGTQITDVTGSGKVVLDTSPSITTGLNTSSSSFNLINETATAVNFAGAATVLSVGANTGTTTVNNNLTVSGNLDVKGTTTYIESTTLQVVDKNIQIGKVGSPTDTTAEGGGISLLGDTTKTFNWYSATGAWTSSENLQLEAGKNLLLKGRISGTTTLQSSETAGSSTLTLPVATDTLVGKATTDIFTNKTFDTAGAGNYFYINGTQITDKTGTGSVVLSSSPSIGSPNITGHPTVEGVTSTGATGTGQFVFGTSPTLTTPRISSIVNSGTLTLPTATDTLVGRTTTDTLENKTLTTPIISSISNSGTITIPTGTDTLVGKATTDTFTNKTFDTAGLGNVLKINGTQVSDKTGTGKVVLDTSPTISDATLSNHVTVEGVTSTGATGTGKFVFNNSPNLTSPSFSTIVNTGTLSLPTSTDTLVARNTTDTFTHKTFDTADTGNIFKINGTQISDVTGSGKAVLDNAPTIQDLTIKEYITSDTYTGGQISWSTNNQTDFQGNIKVGGNVIKSGGGATSITLNNNGFTSSQITASTSVTVQGTQESSSTSTGSVTTAGGAGIAKNLYVGGNLNISGTTTLSGDTTINASASIDDNLTVTGNSQLGDLYISGDTISSTSTNANIVLSPNGTGNINVNTHKIVNLVDPLSNQDAATKYYVDTSVSSATNFVKEITFVGDDSTGVPIYLGNTLRVIGGTNIGTAVTSANGGTLTITNTMSTIDGGNAYGN